jgi:hypothetical protein
MIEATRAILIPNRPNLDYCRELFAYNGTELVFHILACRIRSFRYYGMTSPCYAAVIHQTARVLTDVSLEMDIKFSIHCGD